MTKINEYDIGKCFGCGRGMVPIKQRKIELPTGDMATSQEQMCDNCYAALEKEFGKKE